MGWVYFIQCRGLRGPIKIGFASDVDDRLANLQSACPFDLRILGAEWSDDHVGREQELHRMFDAQRIRGEWFAWSPALQATAKAARDLDAVKRAGPRTISWRGRVRQADIPASRPQRRRRMNDRWRTPLWPKD